MIIQIPDSLSRIGGKVEDAAVDVVFVKIRRAAEAQREVLVHGVEKPEDAAFCVGEGGRIVLQEGFAVEAEGLGHCPGGGEVEPAKGKLAFFLGSHCLDVVSNLLGHTSGKAVGRVPWGFCSVFRLMSCDCMLNE